MNSKISTKICDVTPTMAQEWLAQHHFADQRSISGAHVARLATEMGRGRFMEGTTIHFAQLNGHSYLINGNHTLHAIVKSGVTIPLSVLTSEVSSRTEVSRLYARHDINRRRDWNATIKASDLKIAVPLMFKNAAAAALRILMEGLDSPSPKNLEISYSRDLRLDAMNEYREHIESFYTAVCDSSSRNIKLMKRSGIMAVGIETVKWQPVKAFEFWNGIAKDDGLKKGDPRKTLLDYLLGSIGDHRYLQEQIKSAALAWNAYYQGRSLTILRPASFSEFHLLGTLYHRGKTHRPLAYLLEEIDVEKRMEEIDETIRRGGITHLARAELLSERKKWFELRHVGLVANQSVES